jgi:hypothetical protein
LLAQARAEHTATLLSDDDALATAEGWEASDG